MRIALFAGVIGLMAASASLAEQPVRETGFYTSQELQRLCAAPTGSTRKNECRIYIAAVVDGLFTGESVYGRRACIPRATQMKTIMMVIDLYQTERASFDHQSAAKIVALAVSEKWPCRQ